MKTIKGKIIRIIDKRTVIINLGKEHGVETDAVFSIMGDPEQIIDPDTKEILGEVKIVKSRVKAKEVAEKFTIASTKWVTTNAKVLSLFFSNIDKTIERREIDEGELLVDESEVQPWKAKSESPVKIGDTVQVEIHENNKNISEKGEETSSDEQDNKNEDLTKQ